MAGMGEPMIPLLRRIGFVSEPELTVSAERVNATVLEQRRREYAEDVKYRERVKRRMLEGKACPYPPLVKRLGWQ